MFEQAVVPTVKSTSFFQMVTTMFLMDSDKAFFAENFDSQIIDFFSLVYELWSSKV